MRTHFAIALIAAMTPSASCLAYCPPISQITPDWPLSRILQDVCKRETCGTTSCVNCRDIPAMIEALEYGVDPSLQPAFANALLGSDFMCDSCLDPVREPMIHLTDANGPAITPSAAIQAVCSESRCTSMFERVASQFGPDVMSRMASLKAQCASGHPDGVAMAADLTVMLRLITEGMSVVRDIAMNGVFAKEEASARALDAVSHPASTLRRAAYACGALGFGLLAAAAFLARRPSAGAAQNDKAELL
mmetsp:Transcript_8375/g.24598  ORF Transcript_8375/g.24598 Transcript_8375/m.24598 type:complete len:248 (-) Transcript_8375:420-1163(-)